MYLTNLDPSDFDRIVRRAFGVRPAYGYPRIARRAFGVGPAAGDNQLTRRAFGVPALPMDTARTDGELVLRFDVPGIDPEKIDVTVDRGVLTVSATREEAKTEGESPVVQERLSGSFTRRVRLSENLDADKIEASNADGVLEIRIPVLEEAKPRKIEISTAKKELAA
ncbi:MAG TPA: Hsp20/alpha crystallin family protein [Trebonia sp.]|nr:Hsp20/alpha crystallin family protein [Trebonia sp.]